MFQVATENDQMVFTFAAQMDTITCGKCEAGILERFSQTTVPVVFDLAGVTYVSSGFLRLCLLCVQKLGQEKFKMIHVSPEVKKVFMIAGFDRLMPLC